MNTRDVTDRKAMNATTVCDLVRSIADRSGDPDAMYEGFLLGLETGLASGPHSPSRNTTPAERRPDCDALDLLRAAAGLHQPFIRKAPRTVTVSDADYPTEWTLKP